MPRIVAKKVRPVMKYLAAGLLTLLIAGAALAVAPPVDPSIVPSPPTTGGPKVIPFDPSGPPDAPEPATITIAVVSAAAAGAYRLLCRR
jgi:hypothetical protein